MSDPRQFLESLHRFDLAALIDTCETSIEELELDDGWIRDLVVVATVHAPTPIDEALRRLPPHDRKRIAEAMASSGPLSAPEDISILSTGSEVASGRSVILAELLIQKETMVSVSTGGERIQDLDDYYRAREIRIRTSLPNSVRYENPHEDLWDWYRFWRANLSTYAERRQYIRELFAPAISEIAARPLTTTIREPTGWQRVDRTLDRARSSLDTAKAEEDWQAIGLLCREAIISLAQAVFIPGIHETSDGVEPSKTDATRMLEAYISHSFPGASNKEVRAHARASLALALNLQHRRTATRQLASLCVEATSSTAAVISIIARPTA